MGVKGLWTVLTPFCDRKPLFELQGKTVAVDLSCWICEAQNIAEYQVQPRMYLRNLYFRTCYLLLMDVNPVFVLEGKAPELKYNTISARNAIQFKGAKPKTDGIKTGKDRTRFHFVLRQCEEMLGYMGLACIKGNGEAESLCAYLNEDGLVDGCISQDSDCFAYGAQVVYRNFSISTQGAQAASGGAVDIYDIRKVNKNLNFGRNKIVAMALLIGCDYTEGVHGVGKDSVLKFFETISDEDVLDRLRSWRKQASIYEDYEKRLSDKNICTSCGHDGKIQSHTRNGCGQCKTTKGCDPFKYKNERLNIKNEVNMRNKAVKDPEFPNEALIKEFLDKKDNVSKLDLKWRQPNLVKFVKFTNKFLQWEELYSFEKILPILTRWQCRNPDLLQEEEKLKGVLKPDRIKKVRNPKGVPSYEIIWSDPGAYFKGLIPETQLVQNNVDPEKLWSTIEPQTLVETAYPDLVETFKLSKIKPKNSSKRKTKVDEISDILKNVSISETEPTVKKTRKKRQTKKKNNENTVDDLESSFKQMTIEKQIGQTKTIDSYIKKVVTKSYKQNNSEATIQRDRKVDVLSSKELSQKGLIRVVSTPTKVKYDDLSFDPDLSNFGDENDLEISSIVDDIISRKTLSNNFRKIAEKYVCDDVISIDESCDLESCNLSHDLKNKLDELDNRGSKSRFKGDIDVCDLDDDRFKGDLVHENKSTRFKDLGDIDERRIGDLESKNDVVNSSNFFMSNIVDKNDLFEETFNQTFKRFVDSSGDDTEEYEFDENEINRKEVDENVVSLSSSDEDSFSCDDKYVPLYERIKNK